MSMGVTCELYAGGCGLNVCRTLPDRMPRGLKTLKEVDRFLLEKAIKVWNRRVSSEGSKPCQI
jgi:hypothetical protein